jgi:hypothetical protein
MSRDADELVMRLAGVARKRELERGLEKFVRFVERMDDRGCGEPLTEEEMAFLLDRVLSAIDRLQAYAGKLEGSLGTETAE